MRGSPGRRARCWAAASGSMRSAPPGSAWTGCRRPGLSPSQPSPSAFPELPDWLPPTTLQQLAVAELDLGQEVLGQPASFALHGHLGTADGGSATTQLALERIDQPTASASVDATLQLEPATLDLAVKAEETGGLLAALSGDAAAGAFTLALTGKGPLDRLAGRSRGRRPRARARGCRHRDRARRQPASHPRWRRRAGAGPAAGRPRCARRRPGGAGRRGRADGAAGADGRAAARRRRRRRSCPATPGPISRARIFAPTRRWR